MRIPAVWPKGLLFFNLHKEQHKMPFLLNGDLTGNMSSANTWFTFYGGDDNERGRDVKTDDAGKDYFAGHTQSDACSSGGFCAATSNVIKTNLTGTPKDGFYY
jgi:hypothetical protein